jgi:hypothetical protein
MNDSRKNLWEALRELSDIQEDIETQYDEDANAFWNSLSKEEQMLAFYVVVRNLADAELKDDFETYRTILYERFEFPSESYMIGMMCRFMELHNSIIRPSEQSAYRKFYYERAKENAKKRDDN